MKRFLIEIFIFINAITGYAQQVNCGCSKQMVDSESVCHCDTTFFSNGAKMYWQSNCDLSWLTFEHKEKLILKSCKKESVYECDRLGLMFLKEYSNYLLFMYNWISGCCISPDIIFVNKDTGQEISRINSDLFVWGDDDENYVMYFSKTDSQYSKLYYLDHITNVEYVYSFKKGEIRKSLKRNNASQVSNLFNNFKKDETEITFDYTNSKGQIETVKILFR